MVKNPKNLEAAPKKGRGRRWLWIAGLTVGTITLLMIVLVLLIGTYEAYVRPLPTSHPQPSSTALINGDDDTNNRRQEDPTSRTLPMVAENPGQSTLRFPPLIPDAPDIPPVLRERSEEFNRKFERVFGLIAQYELEKSRLSGAEMLAALERIDAAYTRALTDLMKAYNFRGNAAGKIMSGEGLKGFISGGNWDGMEHGLELVFKPGSHPKGNMARFLMRLSQYPDWKRKSMLEAYIKGKKWSEAALLAREMGKNQRIQWSTINFPLGWGDISLNGPAGFQDEAACAWDMEAYYWRQRGGWEGFYRLTIGSVARKYERFYKHVEKIPPAKQLPGIWPFPH